MHVGLIPVPMRPRLASYLHVSPPLLPGAMRRPRSLHSMDADLAEEIRDAKEQILNLEERILAVDAQVEALPVGHAERLIHLQCLASLRSQLAAVESLLASLRGLELLLREQSTRLPLAHAALMPAHPLTLCS
jgi:hypothetical protein